MQRRSLLKALFAAPFALFGVRASWRDRIQTLDMPADPPIAHAQIDGEFLAAANLETWRSRSGITDYTRGAPYLTDKHAWPVSQSYESALRANEEYNRALSQQVDSYDTEFGKVTVGRLADLARLRRQGLL